MQIRGYSRKLFLSSHGNGVDTCKVCDTFANVDFVHYLWDVVNQFGYRRHSKTVAPPILPHDPPRLLFLHYMAAPSGWEYVSRCIACRDRHRDTVRSLAGCVAPREVCTCNVYRRQTPSLRDLAFNTFHNLWFEVTNFKLTREVTYRQYLFSFRLLLAATRRHWFLPNSPTSLSNDGSRVAKNINYTETA
jgi:hypothetical protein